MAEPIYTDATERLWGRLPEVYRTVDAGFDWPFKRYVGAQVDELGAIEDLIDRLAAGELVDPALADAEWLPWLGQLVGVALPPAMAEADRRNVIADASTGWQAGTRPAIAAAAAATLTGTRSVDVIPNYGADPWAIAVRTIPTETPDAAATLAAIIAAPAKPAGYELVHVSYAASWDTIEAEAPTWADVEALGTWDAVESLT